MKGPTISEAEFQRQVMQLAKQYGWKAHHTPPARMHSGSWATPTHGDTGFPDLVLAHPTKGVLFVELKRADGRLAPHQRDWLLTLTQAGGIAHVWRPGMLALIVDTLRRGVIT
jgi:hypothetical protein